MTQMKVIVIGEDDSKTDYYMPIFSILNYDASVCKNTNELFQLIDSLSPNLLFWSFTAAEIENVDNFLLKFQQKYAEISRPKIILATASTDVGPRSSGIIDWFLIEPILISDFRELLKELLSQ